MFILVALHADLSLELLKVGDDQGVHDLDVLVVEGLEVVIEHCNVLAEAFNLFTVLSKDRLSGSELVLIKEFKQQSAYLNFLDVQFNACVTAGTSLSSAKSIRGLLLHSTCNQTLINDYLQMFYD
jgi:hypothetical protein